MSLKDVSDWRSLLDPSCHIPTDVVFDVREEQMNNGMSVKVLRERTRFSPMSTKRAAVVGPPGLVWQWAQYFDNHQVLPNERGL